ncbi:[Fe-Fe] hydrogenase large subunit C-terminal domain-containing protein [Dendrosporobacter sp. 1207_IL3150]|uniref:[Fe-Fe] hydrogenase large subunit C-terminal domain-containing protein n=1 Tax=Dendrosporobacter sp. 1207_IL3150 TaxID=3084054 RepID=UPI002FDACDC4
MSEYFHSVRLINERCKGCVSCIKRCPTEAIRIRAGKAHIIESRCIDCGECIRRCPTHAKTAVTDQLSDLANFSYNIALPAPALYAQFNIDTSINSVLRGLLNLGFDDVYEVAQAAELVSIATKEYLSNNDVRRPVISSACPAVVRLIQVKFPELIDNLLPINAPVEVAARLVRKNCASALNIRPQEIGVWFITPCPAKMTAVKQIIDTNSNISGAIGISKIYGDLIKAIPAGTKGKNLHKSSWKGIGWAVAGGESKAIDHQDVLVVYGIHSVSNALEQIVMGKLVGLDYVEALACSGGCIGGALTVENRFVAENRMKIRGQKMTSNKSDSPSSIASFKEDLLRVDNSIEPKPVLLLDNDITKAMSKVEEIEQTLKTLPGFDCGLCGSPNCYTLAQDMAQDMASETDCIFKLREKVRDLARTMIELAEKLPPSLDKDSSEKD